MNAALSRKSRASIACFGDLTPPSAETEPYEFKENGRDEACLIALPVKLFGDD